MSHERCTHDRSRDSEAGALQSSNSMSPLCAPTPRGILKATPNGPTEVHIMEVVPSFTNPVFAGIALALVVLFYPHLLSAWQRRSRRLPLPPGPRPLPIIGNLFDWPKNNQLVALRDMCAQYGKHPLDTLLSMLAHIVHRGYSLLQDARSAYGCPRQSESDV